MGRSQRKKASPGCTLVLRTGPCGPSCLQPQPTEAQAWCLAPCFLNAASAAAAASPTKRPFLLRLAGDVGLKGSWSRNPQTSQRGPVQDGHAPASGQRRFSSPRWFPTACLPSTHVCRVRNCESLLDAQCTFWFPWGSNQKNLWLK